MTETQRVDAGRPWAAVVGYSRAVRRGPFVEVAGTTAALPDGSVHAPGDAGAQARFILAEAVAAMAQLGAQPSDVVRTRIYLTSIDDWEAVGRAHGEVFADFPPASTMLAVPALIDPRLVVEIELSAVVG